MTALRDVIRVEGRFQRSARLDADLKGFPPLEGYILQASVRKALTGMANAISDGGQGAFTWTGPYGGGKSSAALLVGSLVGGAPEVRDLARSISGPELVDTFSKAFSDGQGPWSVVPVTGRRAGLRDEICHAAAAALNWTKADRTAAETDDRALISRLLKDAGRRGGVLLILDELGKLLEHAVAEGGDVHLLQDLAEASNRSGGRLILIGVLHQSFAQYAARAGRDLRDEWGKIQGRFIDVPFLSATDETVNLIGRALHRTGGEVDTGLARATADAIGKRRPVDPAALGDALAAAWPLHPVTALLLGPLSRQRFAQNERSVFGFLSSAEPKGFQTHLDIAPATGFGALYGPEHLWDYLIANFGSALTDGVDGRRFALALEAIERAGVRGGALHARLIKIIALIEFFRNGSGLSAADDILTLAAPDIPRSEIEKALGALVDWAILIRQPRLGGYALFAGSDFDLEEALERARQPLDRETVADLPSRIGFGSVPAKRHYFKTGALRTFEPRLLLVGEGDAGKTADLDALVAESLKGDAGHKLILVVSDGTASVKQVEAIAQSLARALGPTPLIAAVGAGPGGVNLREATADLVAIDLLARRHPQLEGDRIARREIAGRRSALLDEVHAEVTSAFEDAKWMFGDPPIRLDRTGSLSAIASAVCDAVYRDAPQMHSELLQRERPSSSAMAAVRDLGYAMILRADQPNLGIEGFPAHRGLYMTLLAPFGLHRWANKGWRFCDPDLDTEVGRTLLPAWDAVGDHAEMGLDELYRLWALPPYGLKRGVMPLLAMAYMLAKRSALAVYVGEVFQAELEPILFDRLLQNPAEIRIKHIDRSQDDLAVLRTLGDRLGLPEGASSLEVASKLYQRFEALPPYSKRTLRLPAEARAVRDIVLKASDPEALLFRDLKPIITQDPGSALSALETCEGAYNALLAELTRALQSSLAAPEDFDGLAHRMSQVVDRTGDLRFDAFAHRAAAFEGGQGDIEGLASLLIHKPSRTWTDREHDLAMVELSRLGRAFKEAEAVSAIRDRRPGAEALALVIGLDPEAPPLIRSFEVTATQGREADVLADALVHLLGQADIEETVRLAALARVVRKLSPPQEA